FWPFILLFSLQSLIAGPDPAIHLTFRTPQRPLDARVEPGHEGFFDYSIIFATTPAPTVRPPSRMAKRSFSSIAIGTINCTSIDTLSPGITISVPDGSVTTPVTSVVRK